MSTNLVEKQKLLKGQTQRKLTMLNLYGVEYPYQNPLIMEKFKNTLLKNQKIKAQKTLKNLRLLPIQKQKIYTTQNLNHPINKFSQKDYKQENLHELSLVEKANKTLKDQKTELKRLLNKNFHKTQFTQKTFGYVYVTYDYQEKKIYVGQHKGLYDSNYYGSGKKLDKIIKHRKNTLKTFVITTCETSQDLNKKEIYYIKTLKAKDPKIGYNISNGGNYGISTRAQKVFCKETGQVFESMKQTARNLGVQKNAISEAIYKGHRCKGLHFDFVEKPLNLEVNRNNKDIKVFCVELNREFKSIKQASEFLGYKSNKSIRAAITSGGTSKGLHFKRVDSKVTKARSDSKNVYVKELDKTFQSLLECSQFLRIPEETLRKAIAQNRICQNYTLSFVQN